MNRNLAIIFAAMVLVGGAVGAADRKPDRKPDKKATKKDERPTDRPSERRFTDYSLILQRNIFSRTRSQPTTRSSGSSERVLPRSEQPYVLTGIIRKEDGDGFYAFIEDTRGGTTGKYHIGDTIGPCRITAMTFGTIDVTTTKKTLTIEIGMGLDGGAPSTPLVSVSPTTTKPALTGGAADILERLRQRRLQEMNR